MAVDEIVTYNICVRLVGEISATVQALSVSVSGCLI